MAAAVLAKENQVIRRFMNANAYDSSSAVTPDSAGIRLNGINGNAIRRLVWKNVLVRSGAGAYYLDRNRLAIRRRYMIRTFTAVIAVLAIILLVCLLIL